MATKQFVKIEANELVRVQSLTDQVEYLLSLKDKKDDLEQKIRECRDDVAAEMMNLNLNEVKSRSGRAMFVKRTTQSWDLAVIKDVFGKAWTRFVKVDDKKVKAEMELMDESSTEEMKKYDALVKRANIEEQIVLDVR